MGLLEESITSIGGGIFLAIVGGLVFVAWFIYKKYSDNNQSRK